MSANHYDVIIIGSGAGRGTLAYRLAPSGKKILRPPSKAGFWRAAAIWRDFTAWPVTSEDLEPYYTEAEYLYQVHGVRGEDPTEPPASKPYRFPPVSHELRIQQLSDDLKKLSHRPFHLPIGVLLDE